MVNRRLVSSVAGVVVTGGLALAGSEVAASEPVRVTERQPVPVAPPVLDPVRPPTGPTVPVQAPSRSTGGSLASTGGGMSLNIIGLGL